MNKWQSKSSWHGQKNWALLVTWWGTHIAAWLKWSQPSPSQATQLTAVPGEDTGGAVNSQTQHAHVLGAEIVKSWPVIGGSGCWSSLFPKPKPRYASRCFLALDLALIRLFSFLFRTETEGGSMWGVSVSPREGVLLSFKLLWDRKSYIERKMVEHLPHRYSSPSMSWNPLRAVAREAGCNTSVSHWVKRGEFDETFDRPTSDRLDSGRSGISGRSIWLGRSGWLCSAPTSACLKAMAVLNMSSLIASKPVSGTIPVLRNPAMTLSARF